MIILKCFPSIFKEPLKNDILFYNLSTQFISNDEVNELENCLQA